MKPQPTLIILHEIYGINDHIRDVCTRYHGMGYAVHCPDLLSGKVFSYAEEAQAYAYFKENVGFSPKKILGLIETLRQKQSRICIMGFSVGATIGWLCSESGMCDGVVGFYGSRIRDYGDITPKCPVLLFFASEEPSFSATDAVALLSGKAHTDIAVIKGQHGFCDPYNAGYHVASATQAWRQADTFLKNIYNT